MEKFKDGQTKLLSKNEIRVLKYLEKRMNEGATVEEIASALNCSKKGLYFTLRFLVMSGWVEVVKLRKGTVGRPKNIYKIKKPLKEIYSSAEGVFKRKMGQKERILDLTGCEYPFSIIRFRRLIKIVEHDEVLIVATDDERTRDCLIRMAKAKGFKTRGFTKVGDVYKLMFRRR